MIIQVIDLGCFGNVPIDYSTLESVLDGYRFPKNKIASMEKSDQLIRLKKGLYVVSPTISKSKISRELIGNHLYGPSYISLESALSYFGLIPERVYLVRSVTAKRSKKYSTPFGEFDYWTVPASYFPIGIQQEKTDNKSIFLIATPEKALCDMIMVTSRLRLQSVRSVKMYLEESLRIDLSQAPDIIGRGWNTEIISECITTGRKKTELTYLLKLLEYYE